MHTANTPPTPPTTPPAQNPSRGDHLSVDSAVARLITLADGQRIPDRRRSDERRRSDDTDPAAVPGPSGFERRRGAGRRLSDSLRAAEEGQLNKEQFLFLMAIDQFKRANAVGFPAWTDVLEVVRILGYRKVQPSQINLSSAEDWTEKPDAPANVRPKGFERRLRDADHPDSAAPTHADHPVPRRHAA